MGFAFDMYGRLDLDIRSALSIFLQMASDISERTLLFARVARAGLEGREKSDAVWLVCIQ